VEEVEYLVEWPRFTALLPEYGLDLVETTNFQAVQDSAAGSDLAAVLATQDDVEEDTPAAADGDDDDAPKQQAKRIVKPHTKRPRMADPRASFTMDEAAAVALFRTIVLRKRPVS
jgi:hypothetical protein